MFFRFAATLVILTAISVLGISLEKQNLALKRHMSLQHYELHHLDEQRSRLLLKTQELGAPPKLLREWNSSQIAYEPSRKKTQEFQNVTPPLLEWRLRESAEGR